MTVKKPRIFLGSSYESRAVMEILSLGLKEHAAPIQWTDQQVFPPGYFFLDSLINRAPGFDFAILVFGFDDLVLNREENLFVPRDNVVFELGLFMKQLGKDKTFIVAPRTRPKPSDSAKELRILSDLAGLTLHLYDHPKDPNDLTSALKTVTEQITSKVKEYKFMPETNPTVQIGPRDVLKVEASLENLIGQAQSTSETIQIDNIALDMEITWHLIFHRFLNDTSIQNINWKSLMIDPESDAIKDLESASMSTEMASLQQKTIVKECTRIKKEMKSRNVIFQCRSYNNTPLMHGFLVDKKTLLMSLCTLNKGVLVGAPSGYLRFDKTDGFDSGTHFFNSFSAWFDYLWEQGKPVWPM